jgi:hypothetical protein
MAVERESDKKALKCLNFIEVKLRQIVFDEKEKFRQEFRDDFPGPWNEITQRFAEARKQIENDELDWHYVEGVSLTSSVLIWKRDLLRKAVGTKVPRRILDIVNSFLGSLSGAIPVLEFIKEYKDMVEACLKIVRSIE